MESNYQIKRNQRRMAAATLTENEVKIILRTLRLGEKTPRELAVDYCVGVETIRKIGRRESWAWVTEDIEADMITEAMLNSPIPEWMKKAAAESARKLQEEGLVTTGMDRLNAEVAKLTPKVDLARKVDEDLKAFAGEPPADEGGLIE